MYKIVCEPENYANDGCLQLFQIGDFNGQPFGFKNADKFLRMHPSDARMGAWNSTSPYVVGSSAISTFPMAVFKDIGPVTVRFNITAPQRLRIVTLMIGTTLSFQGGRPDVAINGVKLTTPPAPIEIQSRGVTRGAYRGYGEIYTWRVINLVVGQNNMTIGVASGSSGVQFLSPNYVSTFHYHDGLAVMYSGQSQ